jgi:hypothetical protein
MGKKNNPLARVFCKLNYKVLLRCFGEHLSSIISKRGAYYKIKQTLVYDNENFGGLI